MFALLYDSRSFYEDIKFLTIFPQYAQKVETVISINCCNSKIYINKMMWYQSHWDNYPSKSQCIISKPLSVKVWTSTLSLGSHKIASYKGPVKQTVKTKNVKHLWTTPTNNNHWTTWSWLWLILIQFLRYVGVNVAEISI